MRRLICLLLCILASASSFVRAQNVVLTGGIRGRVTDREDTVVPGALVTAHNVKTGVDLSMITNRAGSYQFPVLSPGLYLVTAALRGFRITRFTFQVLAGNTVLQDLHL